MVSIWARSKEQPNPSNHDEMTAAAAPAVDAESIQHVRPNKRIQLSPGAKNGTFNDAMTEEIAMEPVWAPVTTITEEYYTVTKTELAIIEYFERLDDQYAQLSMSMQKTLKESSAALQAQLELISNFSDDDDTMSVTDAVKTAQAESDTEEHEDHATIERLKVLEALCQADEPIGFNPCLSDQLKTNLTHPPVRRQSIFLWMRTMIVFRRPFGPSISWCPLFVTQTRTRCSIPGASISRLQPTVLARGSPRIRQ